MSKETIRKRIDQIDTDIVILLAARNEQVKKIQRYKQGKICDEEREKWMEEKWKTQAEALGLNTKFILSILKEFLKEGRRLQQENAD